MLRFVAGGKNVEVILMEELDVSCCKYTLDSFNNGDILK